ncbi:MAG: SusC/RagA family TonB-linked outer membrane protein [Chitinophagales bacterium]
MKRLYKALVLVFVFACNMAFAQRTITGKVTSSADGLPLIGANVVVDGTTVGASTDVDGNYTITVTDSAKNLVFSYIGMKKKTLPIGESAQLNVVLDPDNTTFDDVVVTALAVTREKRSLGYGTTTVKNDEINRVSQASPLTALQGKVAGAQITNSTGAPGGSTKVTLRGGSSFTGDNNALIVVDGVPIDNSNFGFDDVLNNQYDAGNRGNDVNPQDIESVTVLKGAAAVALYGQRGANGAILITTKKGGLVEGGTGRKFKVSVSSQTSFSTPLKLPTMQNDYGQGGEGAPDPRENFSWGPKFDGSIRPWGQEVDGERRVKPYSALPNNLSSFFNVAKTLNNNLSISGGLKGTSYYLSYNNFKYEGIFPGTGYMKNSIRANVSHDFGGKLKSTITMNYNRTEGDLMVQGQSDFSPYFQLLNIPRDISVLEQKDLNNKFNTPEHYFGAYYQNPYWLIENQKNTNLVDRFNSNISLDYKPLDWLTFTGRLGTDIYTDSRFQKWRKYSFVNQDFEKEYPGRYSEDIYTVSEFNADVLIRAEKTFKDAYTIGGFVGTNIYSRRVKNTYGETAGLAIEDQYSFDNSLSRPTLTNSLVRKRIAGVYFDVNFAYKNIFFVDVTGRNDWSSTLPTNNRSYFYPGVSSSFVFTELIKNLNPMILSYGKIRGSFAVVGKDAEPYSLRNVFVTGNIGDGYNQSEIHSPFYSADGSSVLGYTISNRLRNANIKPEISTTWEAGTELSFLKDRLNIDFTWYMKRTKNEIMAVPAAPSSGFTERIINAGILSNKGIELSVKVTPVSLQNGFKWEIFGTFTKNWSKVIQVADNAEQLVIGGLSSMAIVIQKGQPYGTFYSITSQRDEQGNPIVDSATGKPLMTPTPQIVGTFAPNWLGSIGTSLSYKGLRFSILFDTRVGGKFYSATRDLQQFLGTDPLTLYNDRQDFVVPNSVYKGSDGQYHTNNTPVHYQDYWTNFIRDDYANNLVSATYVKLREVSLSYQFPKKWMSKTKYISNVELSVFGNNLWMWVPKENTYADPEINAYGAGNAQGFEFYNLPSLRTAGFGVKVDF